MRLLALYVSSFLSWVHRLGGPGLILLGIADNSAVPLPGSMDVFTILLASAHRDWWPYYGFMATAGATLGGWITYRLAKKGGARVLEKKVGKQRAEKAYKRLRKRGFQTVLIGSILPPPFPIVPFLTAAGIMQYPRRKFLAALALGRGVRYFALAYLGHIYGEAIVSFFSQYRAPVLYTLLALAVAGGVAAFWYLKFYRPKRQREEKRKGEPVEELPLPGKGNQELEEKEKRAATRKTA